MRHSWRFLLFRNHPRSSLQIPSYSSHHHRHHYHYQFHVHSFSTVSFCNLRSLASLHTLSPTRFTNLKNLTNFKNPIAYSFSSEPVVEPRKDIDIDLLVSDIFTKFSDVNDINKELELNKLFIDDGTVLKVLKSLESKPDAARRFFDWLVEKEMEKEERMRRDGSYYVGDTLLTLIGRLDSRGYNLMLRILGVNGLVEEFWGLVETMKKKGYGVSGDTRDKMMEKFEKEGLKSDMERLKGVFATGSIDHSIEKIGLIVSRIVKKQVWGEDVEGKIKNLKVVFSCDLVKIVLENLAMEPMKALIFFRWVEESGQFKHDEKSYNVMARVLGREDSLDRFWKVVDEMRSNGYEMEMKTFNIVLERFVKRKMIKEAVGLYEFAMGGGNKPSKKCCTFLLRKMAVAKELDVGLFSRVFRVFTGNGNALTDFMLDAVLKSLISVGRFGDCNKVLKELKESGLVPSGNLQSKIAYGLGSSGKKDEASEFVDHMEASGGNLDYKAWASLIEGHCVSGDLEKASECFQKMVGKENVSSAGYAFELLINGYCCKHRAKDACQILCDYVSENQLRPWHTTYKSLISKLLVQEGFKEALNLLGLMKNHGFPPYVDPFIKHISKSGTGDDALAFMKAMTSKKFPSISVVLRLFEAFFKARRRVEAQDFLSKCPKYVRNHADVLNLFCSTRPGKTSTLATAL